jgi:hypothetical protein
VTRESMGAGLRERIHSLHAFSYRMKHPDSDAHPSSASACESMCVSGLERD